MKYRYFLCISLFYISLNAQVGINNTDPKAILDITVENAGMPKNTDGILIPRLDALPTNDPAADQNGMLIFLITAFGGFQPGFLYWDATSANWVALHTGANTAESWKLGGNAIGNSDFFGTTNNKPIKIYTNNIQRFSFTTEGQLTFKDGIEIGDGTTVTDGNIAIGTSRFFWGPIKTEGDNSIAIGTSSQALSNSAVAFGARATALGVTAVSVGPESEATADYATAIGPGSKASGLGAIVVGKQANGYSEYGIAIGSSSEAHLNSIGIGRLANSYGDYSIALGDDTGAAINAVAIGNKANAYGDQSIAIGNGSKAEDNSVALGNGVNAYQPNTIIIGNTQKVGIGTNEPQEKLQINGKLRYVDGTQGNNKVLTSDANGTATWKSVSGIPQIITAGLIHADGTALKITGATVSHLSTGNYQITFPAPRASSQYIINLSTTDSGTGNDDPGITYYDRQTTGFKVNIGDSDNGAASKIDIDLEFSFSVIDF